MEKKDNKKVPKPADMHVGRRIRLRRNMLNMTQEQLGKNLGITFQQVQKYEKGTNRVGASRLQAISTILGVPVAFFFEQYPSAGAGEVGFGEDSANGLAIDFCTSAEGIRLSHAFARVADPLVRQRIVDLVKCLGEKEVAD